MTDLHPWKSDRHFWFMVAFGATRHDRFFVLSPVPGRYVMWGAGPVNGTPWWTHPTWNGNQETPYWKSYDEAR